MRRPRPAPPPIASGPVRFLDLAAATPARNMAIDRALLAAAAVPTLRLYSWNPPGVSLGWFQRDVDASRFERAGYEVVRRVTGGGAVVHHHELTYSVLLPLSHPLVAGLGIVESYRAIHAPIQEALAALGVETAGRRDGREPLPTAAAELCFERASPFDVTWRGRKIVGSAQRRLPDRLLQHGSIVLAPNPLQPDQPALLLRDGRPIATADLAREVATAWARAVGPMVAGVLTEREEAAAAAPA